MKVVVDTCVWSLALARHTCANTPAVVMLRRLIEAASQVIRYSYETGEKSVEQILDEGKAQVLALQFGMDGKAGQVGVHAAAGAHGVTNDLPIQFGHRAVRAF